MNTQLDSTQLDETRLDRVDLELTGMTCAACASRIEKKLNKLDGVTATVNYATERAAITFDPALADTERMITTVESIGYGAALPAPAGTDTVDAGLARIADLQRRLLDVGPTPPRTSTSCSLPSVT